MIGRIAALFIITSEGIHINVRGAMQYISQQVVLELIIVRQLLNSNQLIYGILLQGLSYDGTLFKSASKLYE